jgi:hypothetical protein
VGSLQAVLHPVGSSPQVGDTLVLTATDLALFSPFKDGHPLLERGLYNLASDLGRAARL